MWYGVFRTCTTVVLRSRITLHTLARRTSQPFYILLSIILYYACCSYLHVFILCVIACMYCILLCSRGRYAVTACRAYGPGGVRYLVSCGAYMAPHRTILHTVYLFMYASMSFLQSTNSQKFIWSKTISQYLNLCIDMTVRLQLLQSDFAIRLPATTFYLYKATSNQRNQEDNSEAVDDLL